MKGFVCLICGCWLFISGIAQDPILAIATDKTTSLIFPFPILHVDRGTKDVLVQQVKEADNILLVKAASQKFAETNLSVITSDGSVYTFRMNYESDPSILIWHIPVQDDGTLATYANGILDNQKTMHGIRDNKWDMQAKIIGIYIKENVIYYQVQLNNHSPIDFDIDFSRIYIRDEKKGKRTAIQENELKPLYLAGNNSRVKANSYNNIVMALEKFTIPDAKYLIIQVMEKNGGRHLHLKVTNSKIIKAVVLPDLH
jgi:conjugative transposon TraN protein